MTSLSPPLAGIPLAGLQHACLALAAWSTASTLQAETMSVTTLYSAPINPLNAVHPLWTPVQHFHGRTFVVVPDVQLRPMVTQIDRDGAVTTVPLDPGSDYLASTDGHNRFTMGIDPDGYLHIIGDMHGYAWWASTYVERYQYQNLLYWKSNRPLDVSGGFTFAGGVDAATALPGEEWGGDSRFFNDRAGVLYYSSRVRAFTGSRLTGSEPFIAYGIYRYDHTTGLWHSLGGSAAAAVPAASRFNSVLYWEHTTSFEAYQSVPRFDGRNRLHFTIAGNTAGTEGQGLIYAVSDDAGATWKKASGAPIPALPLRGKDGEADQGDLVVRSTKVAQQSAVAIDKDGRIAVKGDADRGRRGLPRSRWHAHLRDRLDPQPHSGARPAGGRLRDRLRPGVLDERAGHDEHRCGLRRRAAARHQLRQCHAHVGVPGGLLPGAQLRHRRHRQRELRAAGRRPSLRRQCRLEMVHPSARTRMAAVCLRARDQARGHPLCPDQRQRPARARSPRLGAPGLAGWHRLGGAGCPQR